MVAADIVSYAFGKRLRFHYFARAVARVGRRVVADSNLRISADVSETDNAVSDISKGIARYNYCPVIYRFRPLLNRNSVMSRRIERAARYGYAVYFLRVNALVAVFKRAVFNGKIFHVAVIVFVIITQTLTVCSCDTASCETAIFKFYPVNYRCV